MLLLFPILPSMHSIIQSGTCHASREGKYNNVIEGPAVIWMWWVESQLPGSLLPQVYKEHGVDHGHSKATLSHLLSYGYVGRSALVVTLKDTTHNTTDQGLSIWSIKQALSHAHSQWKHQNLQTHSTWDVIPHQKLEYAARDSSMGATMVLFSPMSFHKTLGLVRRLSQSTAWNHGGMSGTKVGLK